MANTACATVPIGTGKTLIIYPRDAKPVDVLETLRRDFAGVFAAFLHRALAD